MVGGQAGFVGHLKIADGVRVNAQSGVNRSIEQQKAAVTGSPAGPYAQELRNQVVYRRLPELEQRIAGLEKQLEEKNIEKGMIIITDGVFSMTGDLCDLPKIIELKKKYNFLLKLSRIDPQHLRINI